MADILIVAASPHAAGTTSALAELAAEGFGSRHSVCLLSLAGRQLAGCLHCGACAHAPHTCVLAGRDSCEDIFAAMQAARLVLWLSPVYFYGLPAQAKALIDRSQRLYEAESQPCSSAQPLALSILVSGRTNGRFLFAGSHLALKYFFPTLGIRYAGSLALRGLESPADISEAVKEEVRRAAACLGDMAAAHAPGEPVRQGCQQRLRDTCIQHLLALCPHFEDAARFSIS